jgi:hypothetical protein
VLALIGPIGVGKSTLANNIDKQLSHTDSCIRISFAEPIKKALLVMAGFSTDNWYETFQVLKNEEFLNTGRTWRYAAQTLGTEWGRELIHPDIWSKAACVRIREYEQAIIDDMRFHNESRVLHSEFDVFTVRLVRPDIEIVEAQHISEQEYMTMPNVDCTFLLPEITQPNYNKLVYKAIQYLRFGIKP